MDSGIERLAKAGFALHWLHPRSKRPKGNDWAAKPVASVSDLKRTHMPEDNIGVRLGRWSEISGLYLHIIDFDIRVASTVHVARNTLKAMFHELDIDTCPCVLSGSGGESRHFYFLTTRPFSPKKFAHSQGFAYVRDEAKGRDVKKWDWELHLLGTGAQAVIPPSIHPDTLQPYAWIREFDFDLLDLGIGPIIDAEVVADLVKEQELSEEGVLTERQQPLGLGEDEIIGILEDLPAEEWFEDREQWYRVGMALHHETGGSEFGFETWCKFSRLSEKFDIKDQKRVWKSFRNRAQAPFRIASLLAVVKEVRLEREFDEMPDDDFEDVDPEEKFDIFDDLLGEGATQAPKKLSKTQLALKKEEVEIELGRPVPPKIARLNKIHAVARVSSKTVVMDFHDDGSVTYGSVGDLHNYYENDRVPKDDTTEPITKMWMRHKQRRSYPGGIVFAPNRDVEGAYNHWQGFSVEPDDTRSCALFLDHLLNIFCNGNEDHFWYMIGWLAHMIQKPEEKPGVAIIARGKKRIGKDTVFEYVGGLFAHHYITIGNQEQMTSKFNAHQERCLLLHMQEGFWAGDKKAEGQLKYMITSPVALIEPKGMNAFPVNSVLRLFISSNERWVVPATEDEGRFFVLNVSSKRRNDHKYFAAIRHEMENGGREALLDYLMNHDISKFQVRAVPDTEGLAEQKVEGLKNVERWWHGVLQHGAIEGTGGRNETDISNHQWLREKVRIEKNDFREGYSRWLRTRRYDGEEISEMEFSRRMKAMLPGMNVAQPRVGSNRIRMFILPDLQVCRTGFEQYIGSELRWPEEAITLVDDDDDADL